MSVSELPEFLLKQSYHICMVFSDVVFVICQILFYQNRLPLQKLTDI